MRREQNAIGERNFSIYFNQLPSRAIAVRVRARPTMSYRWESYIATPFLSLARSLAHLGKGKKIALSVRVHIHQAEFKFT